MLACFELELELMRDELSDILNGGWRACVEGKNEMNGRAEGV